MTLNQMRAIVTIQRADMTTPEGIDAFVSAAQVLFPERDRDAILNTPIDVFFADLKVRAEAIAAEANEMNLQLQGRDALAQVQNILGVD